MTLLVELDLTPLKRKRFVNIADFFYIFECYYCLIFIYF